MKKTSNSKVILLCVLAGAIYILPFIFMFTFAIFVDGEKKFEIKGDIVEISDGKMVVENATGFYDEEYKAYYVVGYLKNKADKKYTNIELEYRVYDEKNNVLGDAGGTYLEYLDKGDTWKFKVIYSDVDASDVHHFAFHKISYD